MESNQVRTTDPWAGARRVRFGPFNWLSTQVRPERGMPQPVAPTHQFTRSRQTSTDTAGAIFLACAIASLTWIIGSIVPQLGRSPIETIIDLLRWIDGMVGHSIVWIGAAIIAAGLAAWTFDAYNPQINKALKQTIRTRQTRRSADPTAQTTPGFYTRRATFVVCYYFQRSLTDNSVVRAVRRALAFALGWSLWLYIAPLGSLIVLCFIGLLLGCAVRLLHEKNPANDDDYILAVAYTLFGVRRLLIATLLTWWLIRLF